MTEDGRSWRRPAVSLKAAMAPSSCALKRNRIDGPAGLTSMRGSLPGSIAMGGASQAGSNVGCDSFADLVIRSSDQCHIIYLCPNLPS